jgi:hypothetical protein
VIIDIASIATALGVFIAAGTLIQTRNLSLREFEGFYIDRYWNLMDSMSLDALQGKSPHPMSDQDRRVALGYLRLSEDELDLYHKGWISVSTWKVWSEGICSTLASSPFEELWAEIESSQTDQFKNLREFLAQDCDHLKTNRPCQRYSKPKSRSAFRR